jgi:hypothetical protein
VFREGADCLTGSDISASKSPSLESSLIESARVLADLNRKLCSETMVSFYASPRPIRHVPSSDRKVEGVIGRVHPTRLFQPLYLAFELNEQISGVI